MIRRYSREKIWEKSFLKRENSVQRSKHGKELIVFKEQEKSQRGRRIRERGMWDEVWGGCTIQGFEGDGGSLYIILSELGSATEQF